MLPDRSAIDHNIQTTNAAQRALSASDIEASDTTDTTIDTSNQSTEHTANLFMPSDLTNSRMPDLLVAEHTARSDYFAMPSDHVHPHYELYILLAGERSYFVQDQVYDVHAGDIVFIGKHELHRTLPGKLPEHERIVLYFGDEFAKRQFGQQREWLLSLFQQPYPVLHTDRKEGKHTLLTAIIQQLVRELTVQPPGYTLMVQQLAITLLLHCARLPKRIALPSTAPPHAAQEQIAAAARYIKHNYNMPISLPELANYVHLSPAHLSRTFKRMTGFHLTEYINTVRVHEAQRMLRDTNLKIIDVAAAAGFGNFSHFGKIFKLFCHVSPREYRHAAKMSHGHANETRA
ncbi:AraC family transcriptional regulator [Paenibacillus campi]|uniref:helix-turn-helix transcriptional regulator n=1 Tax=Paenibacillus campi TaxID=3106031 RepID=UPI002AFF4FF1|nr:AraC family transcriptional regulator [Paenibacillus sp. SGZ-1014]